MRLNKQIAISVIITALLTCLITNTVRDYNFVHNNGKVVRKLSQVISVIKDRSLYGFDDDILADAASEAIVNTVGDKHTRYFDKESFRAYRDKLTSSYMGIGVAVSPNIIENTLFVASCNDDGPAAHAGILPGDIIVRADELKCTSDKMNEFTSLIKSKKEGDVVKLTLSRDGEEFDLNVEIKQINKKSVSGAMLTDEVGYIKLTSFIGSINNDARTPYDDFVDEMSALRNEGMTKLVIDLRDNPGGEFGVVAKIADEFLSDELIVYTEDKAGEQTMLYAEKDAVAYPVAIIINGNSASASEVLTAALKDNGKAVVVGEKSFGKGTVQTAISLPDGSGLSVTTSRYFTPSGVCIDGIGIEPDIECALPDGKTPDDYTLETDPQIAMALTAITE